MVVSLSENIFSALKLPLSSKRTYMIFHLDGAGHPVNRFKVVAGQSAKYRRSRGRSRSDRDRRLPESALDCLCTNPPFRASSELHRLWRPADKNAGDRLGVGHECR